MPFQSKSQRHGQTAKHKFNSISTIKNRHFEDSSYGVEIQVSITEPCSDRALFSKILMKTKPLKTD